MVGEDQHRTFAVEEAHPVRWTIEEQGQALLQLYRCAMECMGKAEGLIRSGDVVAKTEQLLHAQRIVLQLADALDPDPASPEAVTLAANLERLYLYIHRRLVRANNLLDPAAVREARRLMATLYPAWEQAVAATRAMAAAPVLV
ncbi:MAG: flagellar export chaperone FliS [Candidatus Latescibacterota bacterium]|jgi:flagellar biosynthetic protein FliS